MHDGLSSADGMSAVVETSVPALPFETIRRIVALYLGDALYALWVTEMSERDAKQMTPQLCSVSRTFQKITLELGTRAFEVEAKENKQLESIQAKIKACYLMACRSKGPIAQYRSSCQDEELLEIAKRSHLIQAYVLYTSALALRRAYDAEQDRRKRECLNDSGIELDRFSKDSPLYRGIRQSISEALEKSLGHAQMVRPHGTVEVLETAITS